MTRREAIRLLRTFAAEVRRRLPARVVAWIERAPFGGTVNQNTIDLAYVQIGLAAREEMRHSVTKISIVHENARGEYTEDDPRLASMPAAARPYAVTGARAAAADARDMAAAVAARYQTREDRLREALDLLGF